MKGRFEKNKVPRNSSAQNVPYQNGNSYRQASYNQPSYDQNDYGQTAYEGGQDPYQNNGYDNGYDKNPYGSGYNPYQNGGYGSYQPPQYQPPRKEGSGFGWGILAFFIPLVGFILWLAWKKDRPRASKASGIGALTGFLIQILLVVGLFVGGKMYINGMLDKVNHVEMEKPVYTQSTEAPEMIEQPAEEEVELTEAPTTVETEPPHATREDYVNFLVVGQAGRAGEEERFADTMMLFTLNKFDKTITVTSLLRDSFVQPPPFRGHNFGHIKLTTVYHLGSHYDNGNVAGSMELIDMTLYDNFGLEIDHNIEVNFDVFQKVIDGLGGLDIELNEVECDYLNKYFKKLNWEGYVYEPGMNHLDGFVSLTYARMRKAEGDGDSDIKRTARQRKLIESVMGKVKSMSLGDVQNLANAVLPMVTTNMSKDEIADTMMTLLPMLPELKLITGGTCPINYSGAMVDIYKDGFKHSVLKFNVKETKEAMRELTLGEKPGTAE